MLRASNIPPLLSRITGDGIHTALLVTSDGELLGSSGTSSDCVTKKDDTYFANVGSLLAEVTSEYKRAGNDISLILRRLIPADTGIPAVTSATTTTESAGTTSSNTTTTNSSNVPSTNSIQQPATLVTSAVTRHPPHTTSGVRASTGGVAPLQCLIVELEKGIAGVASTGFNTNCLVIALAENTVPIGLIRARLLTLANIVGDALQQLAEMP